MRRSHLLKTSDLNITGEESEQLARGTKWVQMVGELGMVSVGGGDQVIGVEAGEERGLVTRTGVSHSDVSGRTWARVTGVCVPCPEARSVEVRGPVVTSSHPQSVDTSQKSVPRPSPEIAETGERILQVRR